MTVQPHVARPGSHPNPYYWGGVALFLLAAGVVEYAVLRRRTS